MRISRTENSRRCRGGRSAAIALATTMLFVLGGTGRMIAQRGGPGVDALIGTTRYDPGLRFRTISTARFDIYFHQREEALARRLAGLVEAVAADVDARLGAPHGRVHVILVDQTDQSNGWATVFPYNLIELAAVPPESQSTIGNTRDWLRTVFAHEYTHVVHLEKTRGWIGGLRHVFGRLPVLQPNVFLPQWQVEGIATYEEGIAAAGGRVPAGDFRMILDSAAAEHRFAPLDRAGGGVVDWPSGNAPYVYGAYFHDYLARRYGPESLARLAEQTAGTLPYFGSRAFRTVFGRSLGALWKDFEEDTTSRVSVERDPVHATRLTRHGFFVAGPSFSPGGHLYYSVVNPHGFPAVMELPLGPGARPRQVASRYLGDRLSATRDVLVFDQQEIVHHADLQSDLYVVPLDGGATRRITKEARAADPDIAPDGHTLVCTVQMTGLRALAMLQMPADGAFAAALPFISEESTDFSAPRWSPDGRFIAAERRRLGGPSEIVVIDVTTRDVRTLTSSARGRNVGPLWLPDGLTILFSSDREGGPFRIYGADVATGRVRRLLGTGPAQFPTLSPEGHQLVFVGYSADGYDLYSLPFDAPEWSTPLAGVAPDERAVGDADATGGSAGPPSGKPYRPWSTLAPRYWSPVVESRRDDTLVGASTSGFDALGRHAYVVTGTWAVPRDRANWEADYAYSRWWPTFFAGASDTLDDWRSGDVHTRELRAGALLPVRRVRWRTTALAALQASRDEFDCPSCEPAVRGTASIAAMQLGWNLSSAKSFGYSISAEQGGSVGVTTELRRGRAGSDATAGAATADVRGYVRALPRHGVLAVRTAAATTWGDPGIRRVFEAGGSGPQGGGFAFGSGAVGLLRGFGTADLYGFHAAVLNIDYRFPLAWPQRGFGTVPVMLRNVHGALFTDAGSAWDESFRRADVRRAFGAELSSDTVLGDVLALTVTGGAAWRVDPSGRRGGWTAFARAGRAF